MEGILALDRSPLDSARWQRAVEIFERVLEAPLDARESLLKAETADDAELEGTVRAMLSADEDEGDLLDGGISELAHLVTDPARSDMPTLSPGDQVGDFDIITEIGRGGMGVVYAARDRTLGRIAALKLLPSLAVADSAASDRLVAEAQAASALDHPNVATIYQVGATVDGRRFIAMARYEGETLRERLARGPLRPREAFEIAKQVASGLAAAHAAGLVHRDVKPENIFLTRQGLVKLLDFGIAILAGSPREGSTTRGTVLYMSPEHARRQPADTRSDVWSLGIVLYEMLEGSTPYTGDTAIEILGRIGEPSPVRLPQSIRKLPAAAVTAVTRALEKNPQKRYADGSQFLAQLERVQSLWSRPRNFPIAAAATLLILFGVFAFVRFRGDPPDSREIAQLAVLPVAGDSTDIEAKNLASALSDEIAARVVGLGRVRLVPLQRNAAGYVIPRPGLHLLSLVIQRDPIGPVLAVSLEDSKSSRTMWSDRRQFDRSELRELGRDVSISVLQALGQPMTDRERAIIGNEFPKNAKAYEDFLRANRLLAVRTPAAVESAVVLYRDAGRLDPTFASAFARQSYAYSLLAEFGWKPSKLFPGDPLAEGLILADRATALDSTSADAWLSRAYTLALRDQRHLTGSIEAFQRAITLDPYNADAFHQYGQALMVLGRYSEALAAYRRVLDLEPDRAMTFVPVAAIHQRQGHLSLALRELDSAISAAPYVPYALAVRSMMRSQAGNLRGARKDAEVALSLDSNYAVPALSALAKALWLQGDKAGALTRISEAEKSIAAAASVSDKEAFWLIVAEVAAGRTKEATALIRRTGTPTAWMWFLFQEPDLTAFRAKPEVVALLAPADPKRLQ
ncbi:MAG TPA: protein kinase [Gemmatimonadaceae bacterium]|nr:protein kinase [Gemmatimonadaceae bacterium]